MANKTIIWSGTVDNLELSGTPNGDKFPMRVVAKADELMTEFATHQINEDTGAVEYLDSWYADYQCRFRDMQPAPSADVIVRMKAAGLLES